MNPGYVNTWANRYPCYWPPGLDFRTDSERRYSEPDKYSSSVWDVCLGV